ncbi:hypothetical protein C0995_011030 [Termitomyces sp. Mi166|nr:hypothetical protein C0995_011030 [Termitomyces sp. Mi166\
MAARLARLPRLTLFSGPNCSLCDIAKAELAKVRQTRPFELETINIQDPGQEKWKKKYVYWIPALHLEGKEIAKGRWDGQTIIPVLDNWQKLKEKEDSDKQPPSETEVILGHKYEGNPAKVEVSLPAAAGPACFNCGEPTHLVSACPQPVNRQLVSLARDVHAFLKAERGAVDYKRIHEVEEWRQQRLEFLDIFVPGEIRGAELCDALGGWDGDWLENMALWGYPKGWVGTEDPRDRVREIIWNEHTDKEDEVPEDFLIFGDNDTVERVNGCGASETHDDDESASETEDEEHLTVHLNTVSSSSTTLSSTSPPPQPQPEPHPVRWATYPPSHFSSQLLPIYNGFMLPPISHQGSSTYTAERHVLWQKIISGKFSPPPPPPPPDTEPPPLPPPPPSEPTPSIVPLKSIAASVNVDDSDDDMDISDAE